MRGGKFITRTFMGHKELVHVWLESAKGPRPAHSQDIIQSQQVCPPGWDQLTASFLAHCNFQCFHTCISLATFKTKLFAGLVKPPS